MNIECFDFATNKNFVEIIKSKTNVLIRALDNFEYTFKQC